MILLAKLILAHLTGDFILQPKSWIREKEKRKLRSPKLYLHAILHGMLVLLLTWDITLWKLIIVVIVAHLFVEATRLAVQKKKNKREWFLADQLLHLIVIILVWYFWQNPSFPVENIVTEKNLIYFTALFAITYPASICIKVFISKWAPHTEENDDESLQDAGKYIGILERLFVFVFVLTGHWEAVGFLIAAKSVFRFGDLKESKDRKLTEYILIGTLLSFGIALATGVLVLHLLNK